MNKERNERESCLIWTLHPITTTLSSSSWSYLCFFVFFLLFLKMIDRILPCLNNTWDIFLQCLNITPGLRPPTPHFLFPSFVLSIKFYKGSIGGRLPQTTLFSYLLCLALSLGRFLARLCRHASQGLLQMARPLCVRKVRAIESCGVQLLT